MNIDLEKGTMTLTKGGEEKIYSLSDAGELESLAKMAQVGWNFKDGQEEELGKLRKMFQNWDNALEAAKTDDMALKALVGKLETAIGRKLSTQEKKDLGNPSKETGKEILFDPEENSKLLQYLNNLQNEIKGIKEAQNIFKQEWKKDKDTQIMNELDAEAKKLENKYDGKDGPKFNRDNVFKFCHKNNIADLELGFKMLHFDALTEVAKKQALSEHKELIQKRKAGFTQTGDGVPELDVKIEHKKSGTYHQLGKQALADMKKKNAAFSFFQED